MISPPTITKKKDKNYTNNNLIKYNLNIPVKSSPASTRNKTVC
jgi:hypothetical protein